LQALYNIVVRTLRRLAEIPSRGLPSLRANPSSFDAEWGTETAKVVWVTNPRSKNFVHGVRYEACSPAACRWAIERAHIDFQQYYFIDMGCGKGRPLLIASRYPFARLIGVEYSKPLCRQACSNLDTLAVEPERFEIVCADASEYRFPQRNLFVYLHNPFDETILSSVLSHLRQVAECHSIIVAYEGPRSEQMETYRWLEKIASGPNLSLFAPSNECLTHRAS
jgi:hypothetical protein